MKVVWGTDRDTEGTYPCSGDPSGTSPLPPLLCLCSMLTFLIEARAQGNASCPSFPGTIDGWIPWPWLTSQGKAPHLWIALGGPQGRRPRCHSMHQLITPGSPGVREPDQEAWPKPHHDPARERLRIPRGVHCSPQSLPGDSEGLMRDHI